MNQLVFQTVEPDDAHSILAAIASEILPATLAPEQTLVQAADLPFYEEIKLYEVMDLRMPGSELYYLLCKPGFAVLLDGTNQPIYRVNELAPVKLDSDTAAAYARFFFGFVDGPLGSFTIVEEPDDVDWLPEATDQEQAEVAAHLMPILCRGKDRDGLLTLTATVIFQNALFRTDIKVAPAAMDAVDQESGEPVHFAIGEMKLLNEQLLLEALNVAADFESDEDDENDDDEDEDGETEGTDEDQDDTDDDENDRPTMPTFQLYDVIPRIDGIGFRELTSAEAEELLTAVPAEALPVSPSPDKTRVQMAELPFYEEFKLYALIDLTAPPPNVCFMFHKPGCLVAMNCTNEPIYSLNQTAPIKLAPETLAPYAKLFFFLVRGQLGQFIIVEKPEEVAWLPNATAKEKRKVAARLMPLTHNGVDSEGLLSLTGTVIFKNALFRTDIKVAPGEMDVLDPELGYSEHFTIGQLKLTNEELLIEDLHVPIPPPPDQAG